MESPVEIQRLFQILGPSRLSFLTHASGTGTSPMTRVLRPLEILDLPTLYFQHSTLIDFILYAMLFNGLAQAALLRRLEGRGGRMAAAAIGTSLAIALSGLGAVTGFSVMSLGTVAVLMLLGLVGLVLFRTLRRLQLSRGFSGGIVVILFSLGLEALSPKTATGLADIFPLLDLAVALALLVGFWKVLQHLLPKNARATVDRVADRIEDEGPAAARPEGKVSRREPEVEHLKKELRREKPEISHRLKSIVRRESKESRAILRELHVIKSVLESQKHAAKDRHIIAGAFRRIPPKQHRMKSLLMEVKELDTRLARFDLAVLHELREAYRKIPSGQKTMMKKLVLEERRKIQSERRIQVVEGFIKKYDTNTAKCYELGGEAIVKNDMSTALKWVDAAIRYEEEARRMIKRAYAIQRMLARITRLELRQLRRAA